MERCKDCSSYNIAVFQECQMAGCKEPARWQDETNMVFCVKHIAERYTKQRNQFCPNCYLKLPIQDSFCKRCGADLKEKTK